MLTSDFGNYSEADSILTNSLTSESSDFQGSELDAPESNSFNDRKVKSKSRSRAQKKVKYWTLPTMSSGTFNPSMLTARQQLQYLAQKSKLGEESDSLELSPLRLDRIKFEEMKSMTNGSTLKDHESSNTGNNNTLTTQQSSPSSRNASSSTKNVRGSKLKEEISNNPTASKSKEIKKTRNSNELKQKKVKFSEEKDVLATMPSEAVNLRGFAVTSSTTSTISDITSDKETSFNNVDNIVAKVNMIPSDVTPNDVYTVLDSNTDTSAHTTNELNNTSNSLSNSNSFFGNVKTLLFDYKSHHRKHFETFLKDFAKRLGLSADDEIVKKKREEIIKNGMI